jgi:transcriptional regulator with XRE-family HTH domain
MLEIETVLQKLLMYYDLDNMSQLAEKIGVSQPTISKWKTRNSILPAKKICRELGIYNKIFGDLNSSVNNQTIRDNHGNLSQTGNVYTQNEKDDNNLNIDEAVFAMFKRAYGKCLDENNEIIEDKIDELIAHLMKFK